MQTSPEREETAEGDPGGNHINLKWTEKKEKDSLRSNSDRRTERSEVESSGVRPRFQVFHHPVSRWSHGR